MGWIKREQLELELAEATVQLNTHTEAVRFYSSHISNIEWLLKNTVTSVSFSTPAAGFERVRMAISSVYNSNPSDIYTKSRDPEIIRKRWLFIMLAIDVFQLSRPYLGKMLKIDQSTVTYAYSKGTLLREQEAEFAALYEEGMRYCK